MLPTYEFLQSDCRTQVYFATHKAATGGRDEYSLATSQPDRMSIGQPQPHNDIQKPGILCNFYSGYSRIGAVITTSSSLQNNDKDSALHAIAIFKVNT